VKQTETVWISFSKLDNRVTTYLVNGAGEVIEEVLRKTNPPDGDTHGPIEICRYKGRPIQYFDFQFFNEPKTSATNPWAFKWTIIVRDENGVDTWREDFGAFCNQDQPGSWDTPVFVWLCGVAFESALENRIKHQEG
jgi:hypothetical protein